jgi:hypothetical protein
VPRVTQMKPQARAILSIRAENGANLNRRDPGLRARSALVETRAEFYRSAASAGSADSSERVPDGSADAPPVRACPDSGVVSIGAKPCRPKLPWNSLSKYRENNQ